MDVSVAITEFQGQLAEVASISRLRVVALYRPGSAGDSNGMVRYSSGSSGAAVLVRGHTNGAAPLIGQLRVDDRNLWVVFYYSPADGFGLATEGGPGVLYLTGPDFDTVHNLLLAKCSAYEADFFRGLEAECLALA